MGLDGTVEMTIAMSRSCCEESSCKSFNEEEYML